jgi:enoyl-CoA hydratase
MTDDQAVLTERRGRTLIVTLNRPDARNAVNAALAAGIAAALDELDSDDELSVGVLTGAGNGFCAGMDLKAFVKGERPSTPRRGFAGITENQPSKPLIAAINGHAVAGGFEVVLACDLIVAVETARFGLPEVKRGLVAAAGGLLRLPRRVPYHVAMEWILTGELVSAEQAHAAGLVNHLVPEGEALAKAMELARLVAANGPLALAATKKTVVESPDWPVSEAFARGREISEVVRASEDAREGATAFLEKRAPVWAGR